MLRSFDSRVVIVVCARVRFTPGVETYRLKISAVGIVTFRGDVFGAAL
jgi:hypothetical protein